VFIPCICLIIVCRFVRLFLFLNDFMVVVVVVFVTTRDQFDLRFDPRSGRDAFMLCLCCVYAIVARMLVMCS
jgi:hypothetical protein